MSFVCPHDAHANGSGHWVCDSANCMAHGGRCRVHRCRVVPVGKLWSRTCNKLPTACVYGCPGITDAATHVHCPRLESGRIVYRNLGVFDSLQACANASKNAKLLTPRGPIVRVHTHGPTETPHHLQVLLTNPTQSMLVTIKYTHAAGPKVVQHAVTLKGSTNDAVLFPKEANAWYSCSEPTLTAEPLEKAGMFKALAESRCARRRWAVILGGEPAQREIDSAPPMVFKGVSPVPCSFTRNSNGSVVCNHCNTYHASMARYIVNCAPEHGELLARNAQR